MEEPKLDSFISKFRLVVYPKSSGMENLTNPIIASEFIDEFGDRISMGMKECIINGKSFDELIDLISTEASEKPAVDIEDKLVNINDRSKKQAPEDIVKLKKWRKETFWYKHINNVINSSLEVAKERYTKEVEIYERIKKGGLDGEMAELGF